MEGICECECHDCDVCGDHAEVSIRDLEAENEALRAAAHHAFALLNRAVDLDLSDQIRAVKARTHLRSALWPR